MSDSGMSIPTWGGRRAVAALNQVKAAGRRDSTLCCICGQDIDYSLPSTEPDGCTVQHIQSRKLFPALTWVPSNWAPAHKACNESAGSGANLQDAGVTSTDW